MIACRAFRELGMGEMPTCRLVETMEISARRASPITMASNAFTKGLKNQATSIILVVGRIWSNVLRLDFFEALNGNRSFFFWDKNVIVVSSRYHITGNGFIG